MEIKTKKKYFQGRGDSSFPPIKDTTYSVILKGEDRIKFEKMWLKKTANNNSLIHSMYDLLTAEQ